MSSHDNGLNWAFPFSAYFGLKDGKSDTLKITQRKLSNMRGMFGDEEAYGALLEKGDPLIYEFYELGAPEHPGDMAFGTSITYPGKVGSEYFMTKGHFHNIVETAEVYYCLGGHGYLLMENAGGDWKAQEMLPGYAVYVPKAFAHRSINIGSGPLISFFAFRADAGHDYGTIESKGYRKIIIEKDGKPVIVDNPRWK